MHDCKMDIKTTNFKEESLLLDFDSRDMREMTSKEHVNRVKSETLSSSNYCEIDIKTEFEEEMPGSNIYSQNETKFFLKDIGITSSELHKGCEMNSKIEIKEEVYWLERSATETQSVSDERKAEMNEDFISAESPRLFTGAASRNNSSTLKEISLHLKTNSAEFEVTRKCKSQESVKLEKTDDMKMSDTTSLMKQNNLIRQNDRHCKSGFVRDDLSHVSVKNLTQLADLKQKPIQESKKSLKCNVCFKGFTKLGNLNQHKLIHEGKKPFKCDICFKSFTLLGNLKTHKLSHNAKKSFECDICCKSFTLLGHLKRHQFLHEGKTPFKCNICYKSFKLLQYLKSHKLIHEGKKSHKCDICCKTFTILGNLKRHKLIHEGKKSYKCDICCKSFNRLGHLKRHMLIHEGKTLHKCDICCKSFTRLAHLKTHKLIHMDKRSFNPDVFCKSFD